MQYRLNIRPLLIRDVLLKITWGVIHTRLWAKNKVPSNLDTVYAYYMYMYMHYFMHVLMPCSYTWYTAAVSVTYYGYFLVCGFKGLFKIIFTNL